MSASTLFIIAVLFSLFHHCTAHKKCSHTKLYVDDSAFKSPSFVCTFNRGSFVINVDVLLPAYLRKGTEPSIKSWIWVQRALSNKPFSNQLQETVYIPNARVWQPENWWTLRWLEITLEMNPDLDTATTMPTTIEAMEALTKEVHVKEMSFDHDEYTADVHMEIPAFEAIMTPHELPFTMGTVKNLREVKTKIDAYQRQPGIDQLIKDDAWGQLNDYLLKLFRIRQAIHDGKLYEIINAAGGLLLTHPFHSRAKGKWVLASRHHNGRFLWLPFIGNSKLLQGTEDPSVLFSLERIEADGIDLDDRSTPAANLKFTGFSEYGVTFSLRVAGSNGAAPIEQTYSIYWYNQVYGGCVFHSLRSVMQQEGERLTAQRFNQFVRELPQAVKAAPCAHCGRPPGHRAANTGEMRGEHCTHYSFCNAESYLEHTHSEHRHFSLKLDMKEMHKQMKQDMEDSFGEFYEAVGELINENNVHLKETIFKIKMMNAFNQLLQNHDQPENIPKFFYLGDKVHAWTYMHMETIRGDYWLSLDSENKVGAKRIYNMEQEIEARVLSGGSAGSYDIYAVYPRLRPPSQSDVETLWKPLVCRTDTASQIPGSGVSNVANADPNSAAGNAILNYYAFDDDAVDFVAATHEVMVLSLFFFSLLTFAGFLCGVCAVDIIKKAFAQYKLY